jgi:hypothetical protein
MVHFKPIFFNLIYISIYNLMFESILYGDEYVFFFTYNYDS